MPACSSIRFALLAVSPFQLAEAASGEGPFGILERNCLGCHGQAQLGGLDLRQREGMLRGGTRGPAIVPGQPAASLLLKAVRGEANLKMPPGQKSLQSAEIETLRAWIEQGAPAFEARAADSTWWSFAPLKRPNVPPLAESVHPIDTFILAKLAEKKLKAVPEASRRELIRRATHDLQGLPPTPHEIENFVADPDPNAYAKLIDRLLASRRYGERWGRHWLDVVRYADTGGFETDIYFPNAWRYRDYVIKSFNDDKPYDVFVQEQIAGDEMWPGDLEYEGVLNVPQEKTRKLEARIGTGMYTIGPVYHEAALYEGQARYEWVTDATDTTGEAFLGLSIGCARCHNHKFDPITQKDYHSMMAIFAGSEQRESPAVPNYTIYGYKSGYPNWLKAEEIKSAIARIDQAARKRVVEKVIGAFPKEAADAYRVSKDQRDPQQRKLAGMIELALTRAGLQENASGKDADISYTDDERQRREKFIHELGQATLKANPVPQTVTVLGHAPTVPDTFITHRGDWRPTTEKVAPAFPSVIADGKTVDADVNHLRRRTALAKWLTDPRHPLTARVIANRVWYWHFGRGIVGTPGDFGKQGDPPTHPELLDWLASELMANKWSLKHLHRTIMLSAAYRRSSEFNAANAESDADNRFLWRMNRQRLDSEALRDSVLAISGRLNPKAGGRPVIPPLTKEEQAGLWARNQWPESLDPTEHDRRSVYLYVKRNFPLPLMTTFDSPDTSVSCSRRDRTTVAPQALTLLNGDFMVKQSENLAARLKREYGAEPAKWIDGAWNLAYGRQPKANEKQQALAALSKDADPGALARLCLVILNTNEFLYID